MDRKKVTVPTFKTSEKDYTSRLLNLQSKWWKKVFNVQLPYIYNLKRLNPGYMLDVGCGVGRYLKLKWVKGVGIDHNPHSVECCQAMGLKAYTPNEFANSDEFRPETFDSLLFAHVFEHLNPNESESLLGEYLGLLKPDGKIILMTPQEKGFKSDRTHLEFIDFTGLSKLASAIGWKVSRQYSFPFPRWAGRVFTHNEFVAVLTKV